MPQTKLKKNSAQDKAPTATTPTERLRYSWSDLPEIQQTACELAADLIVNGGDSFDVNVLLYGLAGHDHRRRFPDLPTDTSNAGIKENALAMMNRWYPKLAKFWPEPVQMHKVPRNTTVLEMAHDNARRTLQSVFCEDYIGAARVEDVYLLKEIVEISYQSGECLPTAFAAAIGADYSYVRVPDKHVKAVKQFLALITRTGEKEATA